MSPTALVAEAGFDPQVVHSLTDSGLSSLTSPSNSPGGAEAEGNMPMGQAEKLRLEGPDAYSCARISNYYQLLWGQAWHPSIELNPL